MQQHDIGLCRVLCQSPFVIFGRPEHSESFLEMIKNLLASQYRFWSVTTVLIFLPIVLYIVLGILNASFLKLPAFAVDGIILNPFRLQQFEFHRLWTAPFVFMDLNEALFNSLIAWIVGSLVQDIYGWRIIVVFVGLPGLVGSACSITFLMVGLLFAYLIIDWADARHEMIVRRVQIIVFFVAGLICFLFLLSQQRAVRIAIYSSIVYVMQPLKQGFLLGFIIGSAKNRQEKSFQRLGRFLATVLLLATTTLLIIGIVFYRKTIV